jgi:hypothetical protein
MRSSTSVSSRPSQPPAAGAGPADDRLADALRAIAARFADRPTPLGEVLDTLGPRASALLVVICALPFSTPISIPGLSTPFGLVILLLATRYLAGLPPWLPGRLRRVELPPSFLAKLLAASAKLVGWLEHRLRAGRLAVLVDANWKLRLHTAVVILAALLLMIPLPPLPPFTNTLPALVAVVMTFAALKRDGAGVLAGYGLFVFTVGYFVFWGAIVVETFRRFGGKLLELLAGGG